MLRLKYFFVFIFLSIISLFSNNFFLQTDYHENLIPFKIKETDLVSTYTSQKQCEERFFELTTPSDIKVPVIFFDRKSDKLLVFGQGFSSLKEEGVVVAGLFYDYDVVLFDYRWKDLTKFIFKPSTLWSPVQKLVYDESEEVVTVVNHCKSLKKYNQVIGLGECYGAFNFVITQRKEQKRGNSLFTKLILDSCWYSLADFNSQILLNPGLVTNPQKGGAPWLLESFLQNSVVNFILDTLSNQITPDICLKNYLARLENTPILFVHGINDLLVPFNGTFDLLWDSVKKTSKAALLTPYKHVENIEKITFYKDICDKFIESKSIEQFVGKLDEAQVLALRTS